MENFTPLASTIGGLLIGLSAIMMLFLYGRIAGISGISGSLFTSLKKGDVLWRVLFVLGLFFGGFLAVQFSPSSFTFSIERSTIAIIAAGFLVGIGTQMGGGCTSGHGVCGISRLSRRSILATLIFMLTGILTVFVIRHLLGGVL